MGSSASLHIYKYPFTYLSQPLLQGVRTKHPLGWSRYRSTKHFVLYGLVLTTAATERSL